MRAEHYKGFESPGPFLIDEDEEQLHRRVGHISLMSVRYGGKNWEELIERSVPVAVDRLLTFFGFLRDSYQPLSTSARENVQSYINHLKQVFPCASGEGTDSGARKPKVTS